MIENLSSKIDSLSDKTPQAVETRVVESESTEPSPSSQREDIYELSQHQGQHMVTGVTATQEIPTRTSTCPHATKDTETT